jgi:hypothetical protein
MSVDLGQQIFMGTESDIKFEIVNITFLVMLHVFKALE